MRHEMLLSAQLETEDLQPHPIKHTKLISSYRIEAPHEKLAELGLLKTNQIKDFIAEVKAKPCKALALHQYIQEFNNRQTFSDKNFF